MQSASGTIFLFVSIKTPFNFIESKIYWSFIIHIIVDETILLDIFRSFIVSTSKVEVPFIDSN
jgi:hypothetical protein